MKSQNEIRRKNFLATIGISIGIMLISSCSSLNIVADYDKEVDFTQHETVSFYGWTDESDSAINRFDKERIENAAFSEFKERGYEIVDENSDLVVSLFVVIDKKTSKTAYSNHYGMGGYYGRYYYGYGPMHYSTTIQEIEYTEGTIIIDVFDAKTKQLIWQGVGSDVINEKPQNRDRQIPYIIKGIMSKYPV